MEDAGWGGGGGRGKQEILPWVCQVLRTGVFLFLCTEDVYTAQ